MTNPDNTVGTNAGYDGRTTPNAFNDILGAFTRGIVSGWACSPKSGMTVQLGGDGTTRDVAIAEDNAGNKTTINNRTATPVEITLAGAPATGNRIDSIVAYVDSAQSGQGTTDVDFPSITGIIAVSGTAAGTPTAPTEAQIRTAITNDGADGASSFYVVLANITVGQGVTTIGSGVIAQGDAAKSYAIVETGSIADGAVTSGKINWSSLVPYWKVVATSASATVTLPAGYRLYRIRLVGQKTNANAWGVVSCQQSTGTTWVYIQGMSNGTWITGERSVNTSSDKSIMDGARDSTPSGMQTCDITISRSSVAGTALAATWQTSTTGSLTYNSGRSIFNVTSGTTNLTLGCELSSAFWSVEALVER